ncbi:SDR family oxidoreductase [Leifsonia lichenia]
MADHEFRPRTAIVTGSDSGIGRATAVALADAGLDVGITWHSDEDGAEETARLVRERGRRAVVTRLDTTDAPACGDVVDRLADDLGGCDVFVNNAGVNGGPAFFDTDWDTWRTTVAADLDGPFVCIQRVARRMVDARRGGRIIAVTSVHEHQPRVGSAAYDAAKHGLGGLIKTLALELGEYGITCNAVAPGEISTPMNDATDEDPHDVHRPGIPLGRPGDAREVAAVIAFLASASAAYVTGASWTVDGGMLQMGPQAGSHLTSDDWRRA